MAFDDFYLFFEKVYLCKLFPKEWERNKQSVQLKWEGRSAGGCSNYPTWVNNPQVQLWVRQPTKLFICLNQRDGLEYGKKREYKRASSAHFSLFPAVVWPFLARFRRLFGLFC